MSSDPASRAGAILEIDLGGIVANWRLLAQKAAPAICAAVVKANAYGLGAAAVARALTAAGCRLFFVATLDEAIVLREAIDDTAEIAVLNGPLPGTAAALPWDSGIATPYAGSLVINCCWWRGITRPVGCGGMAGRC